MGLGSLSARPFDLWDSLSACSTIAFHAFRDLQLLQRRLSWWWGNSNTLGQST